MLTLTLIGALLTPTVGSPLMNGFDTDRLAAIPKRMKSFVDQGTVAGTVVMITRNGRTVLLDAEGKASLNPDVAMKTDTIFQIMSMTKPVTAIAVVMCAERGLLNLDDSVEKYIPEFHNAKVKGEDGALKEMKGRLTIRHLLTHTGGIGSIDPAGLDDDQKRKITLKSYGELLGKEPLIANPGERVSYSGPGFAALGRIVEVASGQNLEDFMGKNIFAPLGMRDTYFFAPNTSRSRIAYVYSVENGRLQPVEENPFREGAKLANPAGGLYSTVQDMEKLLRCVASGGEMGGYRLLSPAAVSTMTSVQTGSLQVDGSEAQAFGLGFAIVKSPVGMTALKPVGSFGHVGAYGTEFWADRPHGIVAVFMSQGLGNSDQVRKTFNTMVNAAFVGP